jgi:hypothetical protein
MKTRRSIRPRPGILLAAVTACTMAPSCRGARDVADHIREGGRGPVSVDTLGVLPSALRESSGLAASRTHPGIFWTHNDSGDEPRFYAVDGRGALVATYRVAHAEAVDWEDVDLGPCPGPGSERAATCLYLGDIGDNDRRRHEHTVYVVPEPDPADTARAVLPAGRVRFDYPDRPHDAEAVAVHPRGDLVIVTKGRTPTILLYHLDPDAVWAAMAADTLVHLPQGLPLPIVPDRAAGRVVTGATFGALGSVLAIRTYSEIFFYRWPLADPPAEAAPTCFLGDLEPQGEAVAFGEDGSLLLTSEAAEGRSGSLLRVKCREVAEGRP